MPIIDIRERDINFFPKEIVNKILSGYKQNINILITGPLGSSKSMTAIRIAVICSELIAKRCGGKKGDYFDINENMGIMNMEDIVRVYDKMSKTMHGVFIIDDASPAINSRRSFSEENIAQNSMLITQRPNENICIYTLPQKFLIDKVPRSLSGYIIYMKKSKFFKWGYSTADIRKIDFLPNKAEPNYPYLQNYLGEKIKLHLFHRPDQELVDIYNKRRQEAQDLLAKKSIETLMNKEEMSPKVKKSDLYKQIYQEWSNWKNIEQEFIQGKHEGKSLVEICEEKNTPYFGNTNLKEICKQRGVPYQSVLNVAGT